MCISNCVNTDVKNPKKSDNDEDDIYSHSSYSFFSDNEEAVRYMAEQFDIDL